jgi:hypothetical protein
VNQILDTRYVEDIQRLALGIEPIDSQRLHRIARPVSITVERPPKAGAKPAVVRHPSCLHALLYYPALVDSVDVRVFENLRQFVPRRFTIPLHTLATVDNFPSADRARRPYLFPGAAYELDACATGIRGRVLRGGNPMRWARVQATLPVGGQVVGRAHGDDRGEFLLVIGPNAIPVGDLVNPLTLRVTVFGPHSIPVPATPDLPSLDPLWDLPLEAPPAPGSPDSVSTGEALPANYTASTAVNIDFNLGELRTGLAAFTIT